MFKRLTQLRTWLAAAVATTSGTAGFGVLDMRLLSDYSIADMVLIYPQGYLQTAIYGIGYNNLVDMLGRSTASSLLSMAANPTGFDLVSFEQISTANTWAWWGVAALVLYKVSMAVAKYEESLTPEQRAERAARRAARSSNTDAERAADRAESKRHSDNFKKSDLLRLADNAEKKADWHYNAARNPKNTRPMANDLRRTADRCMADARKMRAEAAAL